VVDARSDSELSLTDLRLSSCVTVTGIRCALHLVKGIATQRNVLLITSEAGFSMRERDETGLREGRTMWNARDETML
jgi:hypothetical protein